MAAATLTPVVYVVDDDTDVLGSLRFLLETDGFNVRTFRSGAAVLSGSEAADADCFVIDYKMPAMASGIDLQRTGCGISCRHLVILIAAIPMRASKEKAAAAGIRHVLLKPHLEDNLINRIHGAIPGRPARPRLSRVRPSGKLLRVLPLRYRAKFSDPVSSRRAWSSAAKEMTYAHSIAQ